jgi:hypothetical protein
MRVMHIPQMEMQFQTAVCCCLQFITNRSNILDIHAQLLHNRITLDEFNFLLNIMPEIEKKLQNEARVPLVIMQQIQHTATPHDYSGDGGNLTNTRT